MKNQIYSIELLKKKIKEKINKLENEILEYQNQNGTIKLNYRYEYQKTYSIIENLKEKLESIKSITV